MYHGKLRAHFSSQLSSVNPGGVARKMGKSPEVEAFFFRQQIGKD